MNWFISTKVRIVFSFLRFYSFVEKQKQIIYEDQVTDNNRGIESPDLEKVDDRCPEKVMSIFDEGEYCFLFQVNRSKQPWQVFWVSPEIPTYQIN